MPVSRSLWVLVAAVVLAACGGADDGTVSADAPAADPATNSPSSPELSCEDVERFGVLLNETGFDYDYTASESPADLAVHADAVFAGHLTGAVSTVELVTTEDPHPSTFVGFEVDVDRVAKGAEGVATGELAEVFVEYSPSALSLGEADTGMVAAGVPVVVFAGHRTGLGELTAFMPEGFMTACAEGPLLGQPGDRGDWLTIETLEGVLDNVEGGDVATMQTTTSTMAPDASTTTTAVASDELGGVDGPLMYGPKPRSNEGEGALVAGTVSRDGDCLYVVSEDDPDLRYPVLWPYGSLWQDDPGAVVLLDGTVLELGEAFTAGGGFHDALTLTADWLAAPAVERARSCADGEWREVAIVHSVSKVE